MDLDDISSGTTFPIRVYSPDDSTYKSIQIPYSENLLFARRKIAQSFDFGINEFTVYVNGKPLGSDQNETAIKEIGFNEVFLVKKVVQDSQEPHPKNLLVGNQEFFNLMFELLSNDEDYDVDNIWKLIMKLPQDEIPTVVKLNKLDINTEEEWNELIDGHSLHKMLHSLQIISNKSQETDNEWLTKFYMIGGYQHLFSTLLKIDPSKIVSNLSFKSVDILCRLICSSMEKQSRMKDIEGAPDLLKIFREHSIMAIDKMLRIIHQITTNSINEFKKRGNSYDDLYYKNKKLEQQSMRLLSYYDKSKNENDQEEQNTYARQITDLNKKFEEGGKFISLAFKLFYYLDCFNNEI